MSVFYGSGDESHFSIASSPLARITGLPCWRWMGKVT